MNPATSDCATSPCFPVNIRVPHLCFHLRSSTSDVRRLLAYRTPSLSTSTCAIDCISRRLPAYRNLVFQRLPACCTPCLPTPSPPFGTSCLPASTSEPGFSHLFIFPRLKVFSFSVALPELDTVECLMDDNFKRTFCDNSCDSLPELID